MSPLRFFFVTTRKLIVQEISFCENDFCVDEFSGILWFISKSANFCVCGVCFFPTDENKVTHKVPAERVT